MLRRQIRTGALDARRAGFALQDLGALPAARAPAPGAPSKSSSQPADVRSPDRTHLIYEEPVYPKNLYLDRAPYTHEEYRREVIDRQIELMHDRDIWRRPDKS